MPFFTRIARIVQYQTAIGMNSFGVRGKPRQNSPTKKIPHEITLIGLLAGNKGGLTGF